MKVFVLILPVFFLFSVRVVIADSTGFVLPPLNISQFENSKNVVYEFENSKNSFFVVDSFLVANPQKYNYRVNINDVNKVTIKRSKNLAPVIVYTFAIGFLLGYGLRGINLGGHGSANTTERITAGVAVGGIFSLIAGGITLLISHDNSYDLSGKSFTMKKEILMDALKKNKERR